jgi:hypothetical protein
MGEALANTILSTLKDLGVEMTNMIGQGYEGAFVLKGPFKGVQAIVKKFFPQALYVHCNSHSLNLALCHSCNVLFARNCIGTVKAVTNFLKASPKTTAVLQSFIKLNFPISKWENITAMCKTRWVENHSTLLKFKDTFKAIIKTLESLSESTDIETSSEALLFLKSMLASELVVCFCLLTNIFTATISVCKVLQSLCCDLRSAVDQIENIFGHFENIRSTIDVEFSKIFKTAQTLMSDVGEEIHLPRLAPRLRHSPILDHLIDQLKCRFSNHKDLLGTLQCFIPTSTTETIDVESLKLYENMVDLELLSREYLFWKLFREKKWNRTSLVVPLRP